MQEFDFTIKDALGIHARPAGQLVKALKNYGSKVMITKGEKTIDASRLMSLMGLAVKTGAEVTVKAEGPAEDEAIAAMEKFFRENL